MQLPTKHDTVATMSSLELVDIINSLRKPGEPAIRHDNLMRRIENHPGITSPQFRGHVEIDIGNGAKRKSKCYHLPKRECELLVMAESLEVQTKVYDRMADLERRLATPTTKTLADLQQQVNELGYLLHHSKPDLEHQLDAAARENLLQRRDAMFRKLQQHKSLPLQNRADQTTPAADPREGTTWMINNLPVALLNGELYVGAAALCRETGMSFKAQQASKLYRQHGVRVKAQSRSGVRELTMLPLTGLEQKTQQRRLGSGAKDQLIAAVKTLRGASGMTLH